MNRFFKLAFDVQFCKLFFCSTESAWEKPKEGFMTVKEYEKLNDIAIAKQEEEQVRESKYTVENADELAAKYKRERLKNYKVKDQEEVDKETEALIASMGPSPRADDPYGTWERVEYK
jgi:WW domain-binding protein 4